jgi:Fe-S-cluster containining protein
VARARFATGATTRNCNGQCCQRGVSVDVAERDRILAHTALVQGAMDADQTPDPTTWFDPAPRLDADFPSGRAVRTAIHGGACVFLDARKRCVLHTASDAAGAALKPFRCRAFPLTIERSVALLDPDGALRPIECCGTPGAGPLTVLDVCPAELGLVLGPAGMADLRREIGTERRA